MIKRNSRNGRFASFVVESVGELGSFRATIRRDALSKSTGKAIAQDWKNVGGDMKRAVEVVRKREKAPA